MTFPKIFEDPFVGKPFFPNPDQFDFDIKKKKSVHLPIKTQEHQSQQIKNGEHAGECQPNVKCYQGHVQKHS